MKRNLDNSMENQKLLETVADIAYILGRNNCFSGNSRADIQDILFWAKEFEKEHDNTELDKNDYISEIEQYSYRKINEFRYMYNQHS